MPVFNGKTEAALRADTIILMGVRSPTDYRASVLPVDRAEEAAQLNLNQYFRLPKADGSPRKEGKMYVETDASPNAKMVHPEKSKERELLIAHLGAWELVHSAPIQPAR